MYTQLSGVNDRLKQVNRCAKKLDEHIHHGDNYFKYRALYKQIKPKHQADFYERNRTGLALYEAAQLAAEKQGLYTEYNQLKEEVKNAEAIRRCVERVLRNEPQVKRGRVYDMEL